MMFRNLIIASLLLTTLPLHATENVKAFGAVVKANIKALGAVVEANIKAAGNVDNTGGGGVSFSDDFNRADSSNLGANWTEHNGDTTITGNAFQTSNGSSWINNTHIFSGQALTSADQYGKVTINCGSDGTRFPIIIFRFTDAATHFYGAQMNATSGQIEWLRYPDDVTGPASIGVASTTVGATDTWGFTIEGTGNSTVLRGWRNPTANAPTSMSSWDGGAATVTMTDNPATPVDSGNYMGLGGEHLFSSPIIMDNFYGGNL